MLKSKKAIERRIAELEYELDRIFIFNPNGMGNNCTVTVERLDLSWDDLTPPGYAYDFGVAEHIVEQERNKRIKKIAKLKTRLESKTKKTNTNMTVQEKNVIDAAMWWFNQMPLSQAQDQSWHNLMKACKSLEADFDIQPSKYINRK